MKLVADANVLFSAFIRKGLTRNVWFNNEMQLYEPRYLVPEFRKYAAYLSEKAGITQEDAKELMERLFKKVQWVPTEDLTPYDAAVTHLVIDPKDRPYLACALAVGANLWSHDRHLRQPRVRCWKTLELAEHLGIA